MYIKIFIVFKRVLNFRKDCVFFFKFLMLFKCDLDKVLVYFISFNF